MPRQSDPQLDQLNQAVEQLHSQGRFEEALQLAIRARDLHIESRREDDPTFATSLHNLAGLYHAMGNYAAAEPLLRQALELSRQALGRPIPTWPPA